MKKNYFLLLFVFLVISCDYFKAPYQPKAIARVGKNYLYKDAILNLVPAGTSKKDSITIVRSFIDSWATKTLLYEASLKNISSNQEAIFTELIEQYKIDLYTKAHLEALVIKQIDTVVTDEQLQTYYNQNKQYFKNSSELVKLRYVNLVKENPKLASIRAKFSSFTKKDKKELEQQAVNFKSYAFNDSIWVDINQIYEKLPFINIGNKDRFISSGINFQYPENTTIWLVKVNQVLQENSITPLEFLKPTLKQIVLNKRKLELINTIEKEITNDALNDKKYEIYN